MDDQSRSGLYGRVSSDRQEREDTIQSQLAELRARMKEDGILEWQEFTDEGYGRDNLVRPALDRLRDLVALREIDRVYIHAPDRLASGAKLMVLYEEFQDHHVEVVFLKGAVDDTPEGKLMLHMQGAFSEYERTKISKRTRRGKILWARQGAMVGGHAPYGYRLVRRSDTHRARLEVHDFEAVVVKEMYQMLIDEQLRTRAIAVKLTENGVPTRKGANQWQPMAVDRILRNPVYEGSFYYQRSESVEPAYRLSENPYRKRRKTGRKPRLPEDWIRIPVSAIIDEATWDMAQEQLRQNGVYSQRNNKRHQYLLRGLVKCPRCRSAYTGAANRGKRRYRCTREDPAISSTGKKCVPGSVSADLLEEAVWAAVTDALRRPEALAVEYERRLQQRPETLDSEQTQLALALKRIKAREDRITDAYINEAMELERYKVEMQKLRHQREELERATRRLERRAHQPHHTGLL